jgi:RHS repeat-associated protein
MAMTQRAQILIDHLARNIIVVLALVAMPTGLAWSQAAPSGSHGASKTTDTGFAGQVNSTGGFNAAVPLDLPPAKRGLPVPVSVVYGGRAVGAAGLGWDVPISYILRDTSYAHRLPAYDDTVTNVVRGTLPPRGVEQLILVMNGQPTRLMRKGDQQTSTTWVPVHDGQQLEVHEDSRLGAMFLYDGDGRTYAFSNTGPVGPPGQPPAGHVPLLGGNLYTLTSISAPGNKVLVEYLNITYPLVGGGTGLEIDLHSISYNSPTSAGDCFKNRIVIGYNAPPLTTGASHTLIPRAMTMVGNGVLVRGSTIRTIDVHAFDHCSNATDLVLRRYNFHYGDDDHHDSDDPDTGAKRLRSVDMSGRQGTAEAQKTISLGQFGYGEMSVLAGSARVLHYERKQTVAMPSDGVLGFAGLGVTTEGVVPAERGTWAQLVDLTGDGRPDLVYRTPTNAFGNSMTMVPNAAAAGGMSNFAFGQALSLPHSVLAYPDRALEHETISQAPRDLNPTNHQRSGRDQDVWRQMIDWNGDGRVDIVDAHEVEGQWVVYLNTPGSQGPWDIRWRRIAVDVAKLVQVLRDQHQYTIDGFWLPLSRRHSGMENTMQVCFVCSGGAACQANSSSWQFVDDFTGSPTCQPHSGALYENDNVVQSTFVQWEVQDINGDGYADVVFNDIGTVSDLEILVPPDEPGNACTTGHDCVQKPGHRNHVVALPATGIDAVLNLAGPLLSGGETGISLYPFSAPVQIRPAGQQVSVTDRSGASLTPLNPRECGVGLWAGALPEGIINQTTQGGFVDKVSQFCGFSEVNGDGLVDRVEGTKVLLQGGDGSFGVTTLTLPSFMHGHADPSRPRCCADPTSPCGDDPPICDPVTKECHHPHPLFIDATIEQEFSLRDINGDGIPDFVDHQVVDSSNPSGLFFANSVSFGTGTGFAPAINVVTGAPDRDLALSQEHTECAPNSFALTHTAETLRGLYDLDGDGKADMLYLTGEVYAASDGDGNDWGRPAAGRLTTIDNRHGALTKITYRSAKEDTLTPHRVPFSEIVATRVETVKSSDKTTPLATETDYAFGDPEMIFDSLQKRWQFSGYRRHITMQLDGSGTGRMTIADSNTLLPMIVGQSETERYLANGEVGLPKDVTVLPGAMSDPWSEMGALSGEGPDSRLKGATHYDYSAQMLTESQDSTVAFCRELVDPYDYVASQQGTSSWPVCATHGFTFASLTTTWRGIAPPSMSTANVTAILSVSRDIYGRVTNQISFGDGDPLGVLTLSYATPTTAPGIAAPRVLNAVTDRIFTGLLNNLVAEESWQYDGDQVDHPGGTVSNGFPTAHTVMRIRNDFFGDVLGKVRTTFEWDPNSSSPSGVLTKISTTREDSTGHADGAARTVTLRNYDDFKLVARQSQVDTVGVPGEPSIPPLITTIQPDDYSLEVLSSVDENGTMQSVCRDGFDRVSETFAGPSTGPLKITSTATYTGFASDEAGPPQVTTKAFVDLNAPATAACSSPPALATTGISSTVYIDELGRPSYTATKLGVTYGDQTLITDARIYDAWGRAVFAADPHVSTEGVIGAYGTSSYFQVDGTPDCVIRGPASQHGPHELTRVTDESNEVYPTCFTRVFDANRERLDTNGPDSLLLNSPQYGVIRSVTKSANGLILDQSTRQGDVPLEYADFAYDEFGRLGLMRRFPDPAHQTTPSIALWTFDSLGLVLDLIETGVTERTRSYSNWGELTEESWLDSGTAPGTTHRINHRYDALGRMLHSEESQQVGAATPVVDPDSVYDYVYDVGTPLSGAPADFTPTHLTGRLARAVSPAQTVSLSYDELGRLNGQAFSDDKLYVETRSYHSDGTLDQLHLLLPDHLVGGHSIDEYATYTYDSMRRLSAVSYADGSTSESLFSGVRDVFGRIIQGQFDNTSLTATYAPGGRRLLTRWKVADATAAHSREVSLGAVTGAAYDPVGRERGRSELADGASVASDSYAYDAIGQLGMWSRHDHGNGIDRNFNYDKLGNLLSITNSDFSDHPADVALTYDPFAPDRVTQIAYRAGTPRSVTYDAIGDITQMPTANGGTRTIDYFNNGAVRSIADDAGNAAHYKYDAFGGVSQLQIDSASDGNTRHDRHYGETIGARDEIVDARLESVVIRSIPGDVGILATRHGPTSTWTFGFGEQKGNRFFTDANGSLIQDELYSPFGAQGPVTAAEKRLATYSSAKWNGGDNLEALGVTQLGARLYDPAIGRFLSRDPLFEPRSATSTNPYSFAMNDPVNLADPSGASPFEADGNDRIDSKLAAIDARSASYQFGLALAQASISLESVDGLDKLMIAHGAYHLDISAAAAAEADWSHYQAEDRVWSNESQIFYNRESFGEFKQAHARAEHRQYIEDHPNMRKLEGLATIASLVPFEGVVALGTEHSAIMGVERLALAGERTALSESAGAELAATAGGSPGSAVYVADLSHVTGRTTQVRNAWIDATIARDLPGINFTFRARYSPFLEGAFGIAKPFTGTQVSRTAFSSQYQLIDTLIHEEVHHRWFQRGIFNHHASPLLDSKLERTVNYYMKMRGFQ